MDLVKVLVCIFCANLTQVSIPFTKIPLFILYWLFAEMLYPTLEWSFMEY